MKLARCSEKLMSRAVYQIIFVIMSWFKGLWSTKIYQGQNNGFSTDASSSSSKVVI